MNLNAKPQPRQWLARYKWCPDKTCRPLGRTYLYGDMDKCGVCLGQLKQPADHAFKNMEGGATHIFYGANDLNLCFTQDGKSQCWQLNYNDLMNGILMVCKALEARQQPLPAWLLCRLGRIKIRQTLPP